MGSLYPICVKTPKGIEEVERKVHGLALKPRQVLIMIDGKRDLAALQGIFPPATVPGILDDLKAGGFIRELERPKAPTPQPASLKDDNDPFVLSQTFMVNIAKKFLGVAGDSIAAKLKSAPNIESLRALFPEWRTAVKQNPDGLQRMKEFEAKLFQVLGDVAVPTAPASKPGIFSAPKPPANDAERYTLARNFMVNTAKTYLGIAANPFIAKVDATQTIAELRQLFFDWREALKQSPDAKVRLAEFESKLAALLS